VFILLGAEGLEVPGNLEINQDNITGLALAHQKKHGENISTTLVMQGLTMLIWLENIK
jgi:hypothetical protein